MSKITREMAIEQLTRHRQEFAHDHGWSGSVLDALDRAISDVKKMSYITDRPCTVCKFNEDGNGCKKWNCVFEDEKENV